MPEHAAVVRDIATLEVPRTGRVEETGDASLPYPLLGGDGDEIASVTEFSITWSPTTTAPHPCVHPPTTRRPATATTFVRAQ
ncbi:hypothetical protein ACFUNF_21795 [Streptomyces sp. NPDC057291]|uniref:hypothetical protein n=1 Tax=Streptomyces sp. NPDC057291 TaxID=3346087 RepID=UPI00363A716F